MTRSITPIADAWLTQAILEDLATGDLTTDNLPALNNKLIQAQIIPRESGILSGVNYVGELLKKIDPAISFTPALQDGVPFKPKDLIATMEGPASSILKAERISLNILQHASGIATHTQRFVKAVSAHPCAVAHTRKTLPGLRQCQIDAVIHGGGQPHRPSLGHAVMIKDNHLAAMGGDIPLTVATIRKRLSHTATITVEVDTLEQFERLLTTDANIALLDNFSIDDLKQAVALNQTQPKPMILEASGGVTLANISEVAATGVNVISTSQLTMGAPPIDIGLDMETLN